MFRKNKTLRIVLRALFVAALTAMAGATLSTEAGAQICDNIGCDSEHPTVTVSGGSVINPSVTVTITWCDNNALVGSTKYITLNGQNVTSQFSFTGVSGPCGDDAESVATLTLGPGTNTIVATIEDYVGNQGSGIGYYTVLSGGVEVQPKGLAVTKPVSSALTDTFTVKNIGVNTATFDLTATCTGVASACSAASSISLGSGAQSPVAVSYQSSGTPGSATVQLRARLQTDPTVADSAAINITTANSLLVDPSIMNHNARNMSLCAYQCFAAVHTVSTVPYFSLDEPRNVTLVNNSDWGDIRPILHFEIKHMAGADPNITDYVLRIEDSTATPTQLRIKGMYQQGSNFLVRYTRNNSDATGQPFRMTTAIIDDNWLKSKPAGIYPLTAYIIANRSGYSETDTVRFQFLHLREPAGFVARGWYVADLQRLQVATSGRVIVTEGNGSAYVFSSCGVVGTCASPAGDFTRLRRDSGGAGVFYTRSYADSSRIWFSSGGLMDSSASAWGVKTRYKYDGSGRVTRIYDPYRTRPDSVTVNTHIEFVYTTSPHKVEIRQPKFDGSLFDTTRTTNLWLNADTSLAAMGGPTGDSARFVYHGPAFYYPTRQNGAINSVQGANGYNEVLYYYDNTWSTGKLTSFNTASTQYYRTGVTWNNYQALTTMQTWEMQNMPLANTQWSPHPMQRADTIRAKSTDPGGHETRTRHDRWGQVLEVISMNYQGVDGWQLRDTTRFYRSGIPVDSVRHPAGAVDRFWYGDQGGRPVMTLSAPAARDAISFGYDVFGQVNLITGTRTVKQQFHRSQNPLKVDSTRIAGAYKTTLKYDSFGRLTSTTDASGQHKDSLAYDAGTGNLRRTEQPGARVSEVIFDGYGRDSVVSTHDNVKRVYQYDRLNRLTRDSLVGDTLATRYFAAPAEKQFITHVVDPKGQLHKRSVNTRGWTVRVHDPSDTTKYDSLMYDFDGLPTGHVNRRGQRITYEYNNIHRLFAKTATSNVTSDTIKYGYIDTTGNNRIRMLTVASNPVSIDSIIADSLGWVDKVITRIGNKRFVRYYARTPYFALDSMWMKVHQIGGADTVNGAVAFCKRRYGRRDSTHAVDTLFACKGYESPIVVKRNVEGLDSVRAFPYSSQSALYTTRHELYGKTFSPNPGLKPFDRTYAYNDSLGRITEMTWWDGTNTQLRAYDYTKRGELSRVMETTVTSCTPPGGVIDDGTVCIPGANPPTRVLKFTYDAASNLTSQLDSIPNTTTAATYQGSRLTSWNNFTYTYDRDGNDTTRVNGGNTTYFKFSADNRLTQLRLGSDSVQYDYNALGQLVRRKKNGYPDRLFFWDGDQLVAEMDSSGIQRIAEYVYWPGIDRPLAIVTGGPTQRILRYYPQDEMGNVNGIWSETSGSVSLHQTLLYEPWGALASGSTLGTVADSSRLQWKGMIWEGGNTNLYYMRNRWYDPESRRFVSEDPLGAGASLYAFADNDAINYSDPSGMSPETECWSYWDATRGTSGGLVVVCEPIPWPTNGGFSPNFGRPGTNRGPTMGPHPLGDGGSGIGPARPGPSTAARGAACTAAAIDAATAVVTDLISVTGIGIVATKGTQGARFAIKAAKAAKWHFVDRAGGGLLPRNTRLSGLGRWSGGALAAGSWEATSHIAQSQSINWWEEIGELIPGVNTFLQGRNAIRQCF